MPISLISVPVSDQDRALAFYRDVLGFTLDTDNTFQPEMRWVMLTPPEGGCSITLTTWFDTMPPGSRKGSVYSVPDLDATMAELADRGLAMSPAESAPWGRFTMFDDPDGNGWVLQQDAQWRSHP
jgi:catechol 2,3-dioxygenase-like lactoylglutathione lyase family enzyme